MADTPLKSSSNLLVDILHPAAPQLPPPPDDENLHWLAIARQYATLSLDPLNRSGCVLIRAGRMLVGACDRFPGVTHSTMVRRRHLPSRQGMLLSAEQAAVAQAATHGVSLQSSCAYVWPTFTNAASAALLIEAGCLVMTTPNFHTPARLEDDMRLIGQMAAECGVLLRTTDTSALEEDTSA
jgi:hypothetical protein